MTLPFSINWTLSIIKVPDGKTVKVTFKKFLLSEPGQENRKDCSKDYVQVNGKKWVHAYMSKNRITFTADMSLPVRLVLRLCGEEPDGTLTETSNTNKMSVVFFSDSSYVDRGFDAEFQAIDAKDRKWLTFSHMMIIFLKSGNCISY